MKVSDAMTSQVSTAAPTDTVRKVAQVMAHVETGAVPIVENGKVVGLVTDRDIVLRVVAEGRSFDSPISEAMSEGEVQSVREDDVLADATAKMASHQIRRLVVLNEAGNLTGILSLGDVAKDYGAKQVGKTLEEISQEGGEMAAAPAS
ncbi:CBS domain-containing protein [Caulobacter rhizosphaerae]|jgi:CBS domain-containing protein|uniref:CBS domain-containing protein n=1 Tax=Caulobacter rhizosphaerae TaxID=2010972 RepID=A0ABU1N665_9CAUL|nr:CBS domain-containing protein [Caulobacter rhizosphaerae]MDR6533929.1 CBS domain-containing protein [Caulobacter rhizosphaerae]